MTDEYLLNPTLEVLPGAAETLRLRLPIWGRSLDATPYQVGVLRQFANWRAPADVLAEFPFSREETRAFLERCVGEGVLLPRGRGGAPEYPSRVLPPATLFGAPAFDPTRPPAIVFLGVPWDGATSGLPGARFGPQAIRQASLGTRYQVEPLFFEPLGFRDYASGRTLLQGIHLADAGDVYVVPAERPATLFDRVTEVVEELCRTGALPMVMGGDHSLTYAVLRAFASRRHLAIVHLDAHTDLAERVDGTLDHGSVFAHVLEKMDNVEGLYQVGLRGVLPAVGPGPTPRVTQMGIDTLREKGIQAFVDALPEGLEYYLSIDIDVVDPAFAPSTGTPVPGGLYPHELKALVRAVASQRMVIGCDVVEVAQPHGPHDPTAGIAMECLLTAAEGAVEYVRRVLAEAGEAEGKESA